MSTNGTLSWRQRKAIPLLMKYPRPEQVAEQVGVSERTVYRWLEEQPFRDAMHQAEAEAIDQASRVLVQGVSTALHTLLDLMRDAESENVRLGAAGKWLDQAIKIRELRNVEDRLARLERLAYGRPE